MAIQTTSLDSKLARLDEKANEYDSRANTEARVEQARVDLKELNRALNKLETVLSEFEQQVGILTEVFGKAIPSEVISTRKKVQSLVDYSQDDIVNIIDNGAQTLSAHVDDVRDARDAVKSGIRTVNNRLKDIQQSKRSNASTAENIQRVLGESQEAMKKINDYRSFINSIINPRDSVTHMKKQWQGLTKAFENLNTDWDGFRQRHNLSHQTIDDLKKLSQKGEVDLDELSSQSINEMIEVPELRSTIKMSI
jgi:predicted  nucleic acid-binding Zn-ribbon protein